MDLEAALWQLEERFWTQGASFYRAHLSADCTMVFPAPAGVLHGEQVLRAVSSAPRWSGVCMQQTKAVELTGDVMVLCYRAEATREADNVGYCAFASSVYVRWDGSWKLAFHQQSPDPA